MKLKGSLSSRWVFSRFATKMAYLLGADSTDKTPSRSAKLIIHEASMPSPTHHPLTSWPKWIWIAVALIGILSTTTILNSKDEDEYHKIQLSGGCEAETFALLPKLKSPGPARITHCKDGDGTLASIETSIFPAGTEEVHLSVTGYPEVDGIDIRVISEKGEHLHTFHLPNAGERWKRVSLAIPPEAKRQTFRIQLADETSGFRGWAGLTFTSPPSPWLVLKAFLPMAAFILTCHLWLLAIAWLLPSRLVLDQRHSTIAIITLGALCWLSAIITFASPMAGYYYTRAAIYLPFLLVICKITLQRKVSDFDVLISANKDLLATSAFSILIIWIGLYPFDWTGESWTTPANRWREMPIDNWIPFIFADMLAQGEIRIPMEGNWQSSDRPPLQAGLYLLMNAIPFFEVHAGIRYQLISTWAQTLVLVPIYALLGKALDDCARRIIVLAIMFSPVVILNSLFVWPKLLAACYCMIYHFTLFHRGSQNPGHNWIWTALAAAFALLSHGGTLFALMGSTLAYLISRNNSLIRIAKIATLSIVTYLPWIFYQRLVDPPGDRLVKWHFAGQIDPSPASALSSIISAYENLSLSGWMAARISNFYVMLRHSIDFFHDVFMIAYEHDPTIIQTFIDRSFFFHSYAAWFTNPILCLVSLAFARWHPAGKNHTGRLRTHLPGAWPAVILSCVLWCLLMFQPGSTVIHQGSYFFNILCMVLSLLLLSRVSSRLLPIVATLHILLFLSVYTPNPYGGGHLYMFLTLLFTLLCVSSSLLPRSPGNLSSDHETVVSSKQGIFPGS